MAKTRKTGRSKTATKQAAVAGRERLMNTPSRGEIISRMATRVAQGPGGYRAAERGPTQDLR